ncbi:BglG family transcription antiterminator [Eubacterium multiforme]|uniref:Lichenan operon transcriptional antiterminator n=1 Tax=Eubacterium multiforme TaxID=83339 RepID=A0ABT9UXP6_9FIRM|nr:PRD domain-containing protein [Eubacterium multiforme]MDQ0151090.1 lichenan operon transcriptional antiterminator [Eubacterium multiforme]
MKEKKILCKLMECKNPISSKELSYLIKMSSKSTMKVLKWLSKEIEDYGAIIEAKRGAGYKLKIKNKILFEKFITEFLSEDNNSTNFEAQDSRVNYLINKFLESNKYIKVSDLISEMFISRSQVFKDLKYVKSFIKSYGLALENKPHYGLRIKGDEFHYRRCLASIYMKKNNQVINEIEEKNNKFHQDMKKIKIIISNILQNDTYRISDVFEERLVAHLYTTVIRIKRGYIIPENKEILDIQKREKEYELACKIGKMLEKEFNLEFTEQECGFIAVHLSSKSMNDEKNILNIPPEANDLVDEMLIKIKKEKDIDLRNNLDLRILLALHIVPLKTRIRYKMPLKNLLLSEIKTKFLAAYEIAICATTLINNKYDINLSEDEIGYFALHFQVALSKSLNEIKKKNIVIVCSSGRGSSQLLKYKFMLNFEKYIESILICNANEINYINLNNVDYVFSTIPVQCHLPVFQINHFLENSDMKKIERILLNKNSEKDVLKYFPNNLFLGEIDFNSKEEVLEYMVNTLRKVKNIPENFLEEILNREEFATTDLSSNVAFPHPQKALTDETFVVVAILKKPIFWGKNKIQVVFLASIEKGEIKDLERFYKSISIIMCSNKYINELIKKPEIKTLNKILNEVN